METDYNQIAQEYKRAKEQPWRAHVESHSLMELIGGLEGKTIIDVACGEGFYSRRLRSQGARRVVGVDLSERMIELAKSQEKKNPQGIEYLVGDARRLNLARFENGSQSEGFDLATAAYLLNYAHSHEELLAMAKGIAGVLKPGGRFVTVNTNFDLVDYARRDYRPYGFDIEWSGAPIAGTPIVWTIFLDEGPLEIENYYLSTSTYEDALRAAGFQQVRWRSPGLDPASQGGFPPGYWRHFLDQPPIILIECVKSAPGDG